MAIPSQPAGESGDYKKTLIGVPSLSAPAPSPLSTEDAERYALAFRPVWDEPIEEPPRLATHRPPPRTDVTEPSERVILESSLQLEVDSSRPVLPVVAATSLRPPQGVGETTVVTAARQAALEEVIPRHKTGLYVAIGAGAFALVALVAAMIAGVRRAPTVVPEVAPPSPVSAPVVSALPVAPLASGPPPESRPAASSPRAPVASSPVRVWAPPRAPAARPVETPRPAPPPTPGPGIVREAPF
ncbi:MAG: hypothetical protein WCI05_06245 [Myxococcales bacterium]|jgi:hypothetical protein